MKREKDDADQAARAGEKKPYTQPTLAVYGDISEITQKTSTPLDGVHKSAG